jgi:mannose-1-phosphate guanylyltransferase
MKAVILVGGFGSRLLPLTNDVPKQMLEVVGRTMLERVLEQLRAHGVDEAVLSLGYKPEVFLDAYPDGVACGIKLAYAVEDKPLDTGGAIRYAVDVAGIDETFIVVNGDVLTDLDVSDLVRFHHGHGALGTIALVPVEDPSRFGVVPTDAEGWVLEFIEKPERESAPTNLINAGTYVFEPDALSSLRPGDVASVERQVFPELAAARKLCALPSDEYWLDAGTPASLLHASLDILSGRRRRARIPGRPVEAGSFVDEHVGSIAGALLERSFIGEGAVVHPTASVRSGVIETGAIIEKGAVVVDSIVFPGARVAEGSVVEHSLIGPGAFVPEGSMVLDGSVVARNAELSAGCRLEGERVPS